MTSEFEQKLGPYLGREDMSIEELVEGAEELLDVVAPEQTRYKVTDRPDVRTIRYYTSRDLLPKPVSYEGGRARYSHEHLLRLLSIKKLQAEHKTLRQIGHDLKDVSEAELLGEFLGRPPETPEVRSELRLVEDSEEPEEDIAPSHGESISMRRFELGDGASLDIPETTLSDPDHRSRLAERLRGLATELEED